MPLILLTPPEEEPLALAEAKLFLRVDHGDDDELIGDLVRAARQHVEAATGRRLVTQTWRLVLDSWPDDGVIHPPLAPVAAIQAARLRDAAGAETVLDTSGWLLDAASARLYVRERPALLRPFAGIEIDLQCGYGAAADIPRAFVQAIRLLVAHWYEHRADAASTALPPAVKTLVAAERLVRAR